MDWRETLDFSAQEIINRGVPMTGEQFMARLRETVEDSLNDREDPTYVGVPMSEIEEAIESYRDDYF